jgi:hypothetical protein
MMPNEVAACFTSGSRADCATIWRAYQDGRPLAAADRRLALRMAEHPEWSGWWERGDDLGDVPVSTPEGVDPFSVVSTQAGVDGLLDENEELLTPLDRRCSQAARRAYARLRRYGLNDREARTLILYALVTVVVEEQRAPRFSVEQFEGEDLTKAILLNFVHTTVRFQHVLERIAADESPNEI